MRQKILAMQKIDEHKSKGDITHKAEHKTSVPKVELNDHIGLRKIFFYICNFHFQTLV